MGLLLVVQVPLVLYVLLLVVFVVLFTAGLFGISRDFKARGDDPGRALAAWWLFWPLGAYLWLKERRRPITRV